MDDSPAPGQPPPLGYGVPGPSEGMGWLVVNVSGRMSSSSPFYEYVPKISIDGGPLLVLRNGATVMNLPAGRHHLVVGVGSGGNHSFHYGQAHADVTVSPQQTTTVYYRAPWTAFSRGSIGPIPQKPPDRHLALGLLILVAVLVVAALLTTLG